MTATLFDAGARLRAAHTGTVIPRMHHRPLAAPDGPLVAISVMTMGGEKPRRVLRAKTSTGTTATGDSIGALATSLKISLRDLTAPTLVVATRADLKLLLSLAKVALDAGAEGDLAALVSLWSNASEHPGSSLVIIVSEACSHRWYTGEAPTADRHLDTWKHWLGITATGPDALLQIADRLIDAPPLQGEADVVTADQYRYSAARDLRDKGKDWRRPDGQMAAALGLQSRCDASELNAGMVMGDPLLAARETYNGHVVTGSISTFGQRHILTTDRLDCRLKPGTKVVGWAGAPRDGIRSNTAGSPRQYRAVVEDVTITPEGRLQIVLDMLRPLSGREKAVVVEDEQITMRVAPADPNQQQRGRTNLRERYSEAMSWLMGAPIPERPKRSVPLDVAVAAAEAANV